MENKAPRKDDPLRNKIRPKAIKTLSESIFKAFCFWGPLNQSEEDQQEFRLGVGVPNHNVKDVVQTDRRRKSS